MDGTWPRGRWLWHLRSVMWIPLALLSALGGAGTGLTLKRALDGGGLVVSTVAYRALAGVLLLAVVLGGGLGVPLGGAYAKAVAVVIPFEVVGTVAFSRALRAGDLSLVQPLYGLLPVTVTVAAAAALGEWPTVPALGGIALVAAGVYVIGLDGSGRVLAPFRALASPAGRWASLSILAWSVTTVGHKVGIAASGPMPWAVTLALGSAAALVLVAPILPRGTDPPAGTAPWGVWIAACGGLYAVQQIGLQFALAEAPAGYVIALASTSILLSVAAGLVLLGERASRASRLAGGALVTVGAALVALFG